MGGRDSLRVPGNLFSTDANSAKKPRPRLYNASATTCSAIALTHSPHRQFGIGQIHPAFEQWLVLESDPSVIEFCERPLILKTPAGAKLADFWVHSGASEEFLVIDDNITPIDPIEVGGDTLALRVIQPGVEQAVVLPAAICKQP